MPLKISITGPESSGKTALAHYLAKELSAALVEEYARVYLNGKVGEPTLSDVVQICKGQQELEKAAMAEARTVVCDTDTLVLKVWAEEVFGILPEEIAHAYSESQYDIVLLCKPDLAWEPDPLRSLPDDSERLRLFQLYRAELERSGSNFHIVEGEGDARFALALSKIQPFI